MNEAKILRPHQESTFHLLRASMAKGNKRVMCQAPTGYGKTVLAEAITKSALSKGKRVMFVVPAISLIDQTMQSFWRGGITDVGAIQANHPMTNYAAKVQIASAQTLMRRRIPDVDLVIIDEAHLWFKFYGKWMQDWNAIPFIGLSATPWTKGLGKHYQDLVIGATTQQLINEGFLSPFRVFAPSKPDLSNCRTVMGDWHEQDASDAIDQPALTADIVSNWIQKGEGRPTLLFAMNRGHAAHLADEFSRARIPTAYIDAHTELEERQRIKEAFHNGSVKVVCNVGCLTTGVDWDVRCIILARPTKSEMLFTQIIGRGLRTADGKDECLIFDHSDTHQRLGFVTDIHYDELDDGKIKDANAQKKEKPEPLPKECGKCHYLKPAKVRICPACGFEAKHMLEVEVAEGDLDEFKGKKKATKEDKQRWYSMLSFYAMAKNYKKGWAANAYREKFGVWPRGLSEDMRSPDAEILGFIKHKNIKRAKSQARAAA